MHRLAIRLSPKQIADVAAYYAALELPVLSTPQVGSASVVERGRTLAQQGDVEKNIPACANCHGLAGVGTGPMLPALAGQPFDYLQMQLHAWKHETRKNDDGGLMRAVAAKLSDQDIDATAHYYSRVQPLLAEP
jgi:cytochrome c553